MSETKYEKALKLWGKAKLEEYLSEPRGWFVEPRSERVKIDAESVEVRLNSNEGYACCGGSDPNCYCSFAESPSFDVFVTGADEAGEAYCYIVSADCFDFATMMREMSEFDV